MRIYQINLEGEYVKLWKSVEELEVYLRCSREAFLSKVYKGFFYKVQE